MKNLFTDVLIVGAGPTGLFLSNILASFNIKNVLIEKNKSTVKEPRAVSIDDESLRVIQSLGVINKFLNKISINYGSYYISPNGKNFAVIEPTSKTYGFHKRNSFDQPDLEDLLLKNLITKYKSNVFFNTEFLNFSQKQDYVCSNIITDKKKFQITSKYVVGCDGANSTIRKLLNIKLIGSSFKENWLIVDLFNSNNKFRHTQVFCDARRPCITLPGPRGIRRYEFKLDQSESKKDCYKSDFIKKLLNAKGESNNSIIRRKCIYTFNALIANSWYKKRILLAGDSAHQTPPFAGQGMNSGVRDALNLGWKLAFAITNCNSKILKTYEQERKNHISEMIKISLLMGSILAPKNKILGFLTRLLFYIISYYKPAKDYVTQMKFKPQPSFNDGFLWRTYKNEENQLIGQLFPQPIVDDFKGNQYLLDDILGNDFCIIIYASSPENFISDKLIKKFKTKNINIVGITPEWINPIKTNFNIVRDSSKTLSNKQYIKCLNKAFFIRPDKYIATITKAQNFESIYYLIDEFKIKLD